MARAISDIKKPRGRPRIDATPIGLRLPPDQLARLDAWIASQPAPKPTRPEAVRRLIDTALTASADSKQPRVQGKGLQPTTLGRNKSAKGAVTKGTAPSARKAPRAKPATMAKAAQIRALREQGAR